MPRDYHQTALARVSSPVARRVLDQLRQLLPAPPARSDPEQYYADWSESLSLADASRQYAKWLRQQLKLLNVPGVLISDLDDYDLHQHPVDEALEALAPSATSDSLEGSVEWIAGNLEDLVGPPPFLEELPLRRSRIILLFSLPALLGATIVAFSGISGLAMFLSLCIPLLVLWLPFPIYNWMRRRFLAQKRLVDRVELYFHLCDALADPEFSPRVSRRPRPRRRPSSKQKRK